MSSSEEPTVQIIVEDCTTEDEDRVFTQQHFNSVLSLELTGEEVRVKTRSPKRPGKIMKIKTKKQQIKKVKVPKFPFGVYPKPKVVNPSLAGHFQQASHGLNETWIFWIDENIAQELY